MGLISLGSLFRPSGDVSALVAVLPFGIFDSVVDESLFSVPFDSAGFSPPAAPSFVGKDLGRFSFDSRLGFSRSDLEVDDSG